MLICPPCESQQMLGTEVQKQLVARVFCTFIVEVGVGLHLINSQWSYLHRHFVVD